MKIRCRLLTSPVRMVRAAGMLVVMGGFFILTGCLPEDEIIGMSISPDGKKIAIVYENKGLHIATPDENDIQSTRYFPVTGSVAWSPDSRSVYFTSDGSARGFSTSANILRFITGEDPAAAKTVTSYPSREDFPTVGKAGLYYRSTENGKSEIYLLPHEKTKSEIIPIETDADIVSYSPVTGTTETIAFFDFENIRPRLNLFDQQTSTVKTVVKDESTVNLIAGPLAVSPDGSYVAYLRDLTETKSTDIHFRSYHDNSSLSGKKLIVKSLHDLSAPEKVVYEHQNGIARPVFTGSGTILCEADGKIVEVGLDGAVKTLPAEFPAAMPVPKTGTDKAGEFFFLAAKQLLASADSITTSPRVRIMEIQDKMLLAEEYFRIGRSGQSMSLYEEIAADIQKTRDPVLMKFLYLANLRRLGKSTEAAKELEGMLKNEEIPEEISEEYLWRLLGLTYYLELKDFPKSRAALSRYEEITSGTLEEPEKDVSLNFLTLLRSEKEDFLTTVSQAVNARLNGDFSQTRALFLEALRHAPESPAMQNLYLSALDGFDREAYFYSPTQRPFHYTKKQQLDFYADFLTAAKNAPSEEEVKLNLFLLKIETGDFTGARELLMEAMDTAAPDQHPEGILEVFRNYLETPEMQEWLDRGMAEVFLHPAVRPKLESLLSRGEDNFFLGLAAMKLALTQGTPEQARKEGDHALTHWNLIIDEEKDAYLNAFYGRLLVMRAREAELRDLYGEAAALYQQALTFLRDNEVDNFEFQEEIQYRGEMIRFLSVEHPTVLEKLKRIESRGGVDIVNPTWKREILNDALESYLNLYDTTTGTLHSLMASECGNVYVKLNRSWHARAAYLEAGSDLSLDFIRRKAWFELAAIDENLNDPWNAARWYGKIADLPFNDANQRLHFVYQVSRLHLMINYNVQAARDALSVILSTKPDTPLGIRCRELLVNTGL